MCFGLSKDELRSTGSVTTWMQESYVEKEAVLGYCPFSHAGDKNSDYFVENFPIFSQVTLCSNKVR